MYRGPSSNRWWNSIGGVQCRFSVMLSSFGGDDCLPNGSTSLPVSKHQGRFQPDQILKTYLRCHTRGRNVVTIVSPRDDQGAIAQDRRVAEPIVTTAFSPGFEGPVLAT